MKTPKRKLWAVQKHTKTRVFLLEAISALKALENTQKCKNTQKHVCSRLCSRNLEFLRASKAHKNTWKTPQPDAKTHKNTCVSARWLQKTHKNTCFQTQKLITCKCTCFYVFLAFASVWAPLADPEGPGCPEALERRPQGTPSARKEAQGDPKETPKAPQRESEGSKGTPKAPKGTQRHPQGTRRDRKSVKTRDSPRKSEKSR